MMTVNDGSFLWAAERKQNFVGRRLHTNEKGEIAVPEWLCMQELGIYGNGFFKLVPRCDK